MAFALTLDFFSGSHCETTDITESETELSSTGEREVILKAILICMRQVVISRK
jgi:hypothetical protein